MQQVTAQRRRFKDPSPSRLAWRFQRLLLTPMFVWGMRIGMPLLLILSVWAYVAWSPERRLAVSDAYTDLRASFQNRPEFMVQMMSIDGVSNETAQDIRQNLSVKLPISSFDLDLAEMRETVLSLPSLKDATLRIRPGGVLKIDVLPREPVVLWRTAKALSLLDLDGAHVSYITFRHERADLPLIAGEGGNASVGEALALLQIAAPLGERVRAIQRIGERRWDLVLDRGQRILLPSVGAGQALEHVMALEDTQELLTRDVLHVDMRIHGRPTVLLSENASQELWRIRQIALEG